VKHTNIPVPQVAYGYALQKVGEREIVLNDKATPDGAREESVRQIFRDRAAAAEEKLKALEAGGAAYLAAEKAKLGDKLEALKAAKEPDA
ncbi:MAG TPA: hypothetical protein PLW86_11115, partial [Rhodocyclaceae bacterium]|nr:hypothetical protein [Rhodocyclaceae bacterium]